MILSSPRTRFARHGFDRSPPDYSLLRDYQRTGVDALRAHDAFLLADEMRLGKSAQALRALEKNARAIVVCPASVIGVWEREVKRWRPDLRPAPREEIRRPQRGEVLICSWGWLPERLPGTDKVVLDDMSDVTLIGDEAHYVMSHGALRTKAFRALRRQCGRCWGLTATPMPGDPRQLWGVLVSLGLSHVFRDDDEFLELCGGTPKFVRDVRTGRLRQAGYRWGSISPEVRRRVEPVMLRRLAKDYVSLPPKIYQDVPVPCPEDLRPYLDEQKAEWEKLDQSETPPFALLAEARAALAKSRAGAAVTFVKESTAESPVVVFSAHVEPVKAFAGVEGAGWVVGEQASHDDRDRTIELFRSGKLRILAMTIQTGGVGLDLSRADGILFVDRPYTPGEEEQAEARGLAVGKTSPVAIWRMVSDHPIDVRVSEILDEKRRLLGEIGL